jgi:hypothetical protein
MKNYDSPASSGCLTWRYLPDTCKPKLMPLKGNIAFGCVPAAAWVITLVICGDIVIIISIFI